MILCTTATAFNTDSQNLVATPSDQAGDVAVEELSAPAQSVLTAAGTETASESDLDKVRTTLVAKRAKFIGRPGHLCKKCKGAWHWLNMMGGIACCKCSPIPVTAKNVDSRRLVSDGGVWCVPDIERHGTLENPLNFSSAQSLTLTEEEQEACDWIRLFLEPGQVTELRALDVDRGYGRSVTVQGYFSYDNAALMAKTAIRLSKEKYDGKPKAKPAVGVYFTLNPVDPSLLARSANDVKVAESDNGTTDKDILRRRWLLIDFDPERKSGISSTDIEKATAVDLLETVKSYLTESGWPEPIVIDSGNGWHLYYRIDEPAEDGELVKGVLHTLSDRFSTDKVKIDAAVFNPARITKFPGTWSRKGDSTEDRPHRKSAVRSRPDGASNPVTTAQLEVLANEWRAKEEAKKAARITQPATESKPGRRKHSKAISDRARNYIDKMPPGIQGQDGSGATYKVACVLVKGFNLSFNCALEVAREWNQTCQPPWPDDELCRKLREAEKSSFEDGYLIKNDRPATRSKSKPAAIDTSGLPEDSLLHKENQTDAKLSTRFAEMFHEELKYVPEWGKWLVWNGTRWTIDNTGRQIQCAKQFAAFIWAESEKYKPEPDEDGEEKPGPLDALAVRVGGKKFLFDIVLLAQSEPDVQVRLDLLDADRHLFNCLNGTVDLKTGELKPHCRDDYITKLCPTKYDPNATCPLWLAALKKIMCDEDDLVEFLKRWRGYGITGETSECKIAIFWGMGSNGKGVEFLTILHVLGKDYFNFVSSNIVAKGVEKEHPTIFVQLHGQRTVILDEMEEGFTLSESTVKKITSEDPISTRRMNENFWSFLPTHKATIPTNHKPGLRGRDNGILRRILFVPFLQTFWDPDNGETGPEDLRQDKSLRSKLEVEAEGILAWLVDGAKEWYATGLNVPLAVQSATAEYKVSEDILGLFVDECCLVGDVYKEKGSVFYKAYEHWMEGNGDRAVSGTKFGKSMADRFKKTTSDGVWYSGVCVREEKKSPTGKNKEEKEESENET